MVEIVLGLDIGTQFCSAAYMCLNNKDENLQCSKVHRIQFSNGEYEMPTEICYKQKEGEFELLVGQTAVDEIAAFNSNGGTDKSIYILCDLEKNRKPEWSLKTLMRVQGKDRSNPNIDFVNCCNEAHSQKLDIIMWKFIDKLKKEIDAQFNGGGYTIKKLFAAYPGTVNEDGGKSANKYRQSLEQILSEKFKVEKTNIGLPIEGQCAANLLKYIYELRGNSGEFLPSVICSVDVGAGTTDVSIALKNDDGTYNAKWYDASDFGGKNVDAAMYAYKEDGKQPLGKYQAPQLMIGYKKWMTDQKGGEEILGLSQKDFCKHVKEAVSNDLKNKCINSVEASLKEFYKDYTVYFGPITFVLMGGSSALPWVEEELKTFLEGYKEEQRRFSGYEIASLNDFKDDCIIEKMEDSKDVNISIDNSNFLAISAAFSAFTAAGGEKIRFYAQEEGSHEKLKSSVILGNKRSNYAFNTYAIKLTTSNGKDAGYAILVDGEFTGDKRYYLAEPTRMNDSRSNYDIGAQVYQLFIKDGKRLRGKEGIKQEEEKGWVEGKEEVKLGDDYVGYNENKGIIPNSQGKFFYCAMVYDNTQYGSNALHMYVYLTEPPYTCYKNPSDPEIPFADFVKEAYKQAQSEKEKDPRYTIPNHLQQVYDEILIAEASARRAQERAERAEREAREAQERAVREARERAERAEREAREAQERAERAEREAREARWRAERAERAEKKQRRIKWSIFVWALVCCAFIIGGLCGAYVGSNANLGYWAFAAVGILLLLIGGILIAVQYHKHH